MTEVGGRVQRQFVDPRRGWKGCRSRRSAARLVRSQTLLLAREKLRELALETVDELLLLHFESRLELDLGDCGAVHRSDRWAGDNRVPRNPENLPAHLTLTFSARSW